MLNEMEDYRPELLLFTANEWTKIHVQNHINSNLFTDYCTHLLSTASMNGKRMRPPPLSANCKSVMQPANAVKILELRLCGMENWDCGGTPPTHIGEETPRTCGPSKQNTKCKVRSTGHTHLQVPAILVVCNSHYR